jgi:hypothetical protein
MRGVGMIFFSAVLHPEGGARKQSSGGYNFWGNETEAVAFF